MSRLQFILLGQCLGQTSQSSPPQGRNVCLSWVKGHSTKNILLNQPMIQGIYIYRTCPEIQTESGFLSPGQSMFFAQDSSMFSP